MCTCEGALESICSHSKPLPNLSHGGIRSIRIRCRGLHDICVHVTISCTLLGICTQYNKKKGVVYACGMCMCMMVWPSSEVILGYCSNVLAVAFASCCADCYGLHDICLHVNVYCVLMLWIRILNFCMNCMCMLYVYMGRILKHPKSYRAIAQSFSRGHSLHLYSLLWPS